MENDFLNLFKRIVDNQCRLSMEFGYTKTTDWILTIYDQRNGQRGFDSKELKSFQDYDRKRVFAQAYVWLTKWMCENYQGY